MTVPVALAITLGWLCVAKKLNSAYEKRNVTLAVAYETAWRTWTASGSPADLKVDFSAVAETP